MPSSLLRVLIVGCGNMGASHATAYHTLDGFEIVGLVSTGQSKHTLNAQLGGGYALFDDYAEALQRTRPDAVCISTYPDTHEAFAVQALAAGCHVFLEKPLATTLAGAERVVAAARQAGRQVLVGYILRVHPSWARFVEEARHLGKPLVMRLNLNQQSHGPMWTVHRNLLKSLSPIVDCGVHYLDVMLQITDSRPVQVRGMGVRLSPEIDPAQVNYGHLQVIFEDGSVGWYEAGWGPMISETAFFVKDVMGPKGSVSIIMEDGAASADVDTHTKTARIRLHHAATGPDGGFLAPDELLSMADEPGHQALCEREQAFVLDAIRNDRDLGRHMQDAVRSLGVVLAADRSMRERRAIDL